jgi:NAD(P)-dependent dehydrogenase (short-subunit alcohol dehydrogenase family)
MSLYLITGATGGIGSEIARRARAAGHTVAALARNAERLDALAAETGAAPYPCDVFDADALGATVERIVTEHGPIDGLVHAIGSIALRPLHATSVDDWRAAFELNATSAFLAIKAVVPKMMREKRGSVVLFSTVAVQTGLQNHETVAASKGAIEALVRSAAISYARYNIRFNAIAPALTRTELSRSFWSNDAMLQASVAMHPLGRIGEPADIAAAALFALGDDAGWMTGQVIGVDGGLSAGVQPPRTKL